MAYIYGEGYPVGNPYTPFRGPLLPKLSLNIFECILYVYICTTLTWSVCHKVATNDKEHPDTPLNLACAGRMLGIIALLSMVDDASLLANIARSLVRHMRW